MRRPKPRDLAAFLIDQHHGGVAGDAAAHGPDQRADLVRGRDIVIEQDEPGWADIGKKRGLVGGHGPMNEGVEIDSEVAHGARSVIEEQVTNGVAVRMALLYGVATPGREAQ